MGSTDNGTQKLESNDVEKLKTSGIPTQNSCSDSLTPENYKSNSDTVVVELEDKIKVAGALGNEKSIGSTGEISAPINEMGQTPGVIIQNCSSEERGPLMENVNTLSILENLESVSYNVQSSLTSLDKTATCASVSGSDLGHIENEDKRINAQSTNSKAKLKSPVITTWVLRSKSREKLKEPGPGPEPDPEPDTTVKAGSIDGENKRKRRKKKKMNKGSVNEFSRTKTHMRYLLHRIKYEQNLIDAYTAEGWKRQSVEKLKPEKELQRAKSHILRYKLRIRDLFRHLDLSLAVGKHPESLFDSAGEIDSEDIFCAKCGSKDLSLDNDIILCDGVCERGFHQFCLEPPLLKAEIPPDDVGWLCPGCDCKVDFLDMLKDFQGVNLDVDDNWEKIFPEAAAAGKKQDAGSESSDDSLDEDYDPKLQTVKVQDESSSDESNYFSASDGLATAPDKDNYLDLPSEDSADNDFDPTAPDQDEQVKESSSSSDFTSDSEDLGALLDDAITTGKDPEHDPAPSDCKLPTKAAGKENPAVGKTKGLKAEVAYLMETNDQPVSGKRRVERLDYQKLFEETYGNSSCSSDEEFGASSSDSGDGDFDDTTPAKRRRMSREKTMVVSLNRIPITTSKVEAKDENQEEIHRLPKRTRKKIMDSTNKSSAEAVSPDTSTNRSAHKRLGEAATQRLYQSFKENQYPQRDVKENLAKELGITIRQVSKWFENARWSHNHRPQMKSNTSAKPHEPQAPATAENTPSDQLRSQNLNPGVGVENMVTDTNGGASGIGNSRQRNAKKGQATPSTINQNVQGDTPFPQLVTGKRQTRNSKTVA